MWSCHFVDPSCQASSYIPLFLTTMALNQSASFEEPLAAREATVHFKTKMAAPEEFNVNAADISCVW